MPQPNQISHIFSSLSVWEHFTKTSGATSDHITLVNAHIGIAMPLLDQYYKAFPKYTLHNTHHQINIVKLMGDLLGDDVTKLSPLECAMLLLSAIYHDIGMVYSDNELQNIGNEQEFKVFLGENTRAKLEYEENEQKPTAGLIEWYCRWMHAKRVWVYLNVSYTSTPLRWDNVSIKDKLGHLCESHNLSVQDIISDLDTFNNDYLGKCDLVFCAILLRLADILDFDNSRSPKSVYEFLDLDNPKNKLDAYSKIEWEKHLNSNGFEFKREAANLKVLFSATTPHPNIEVAIRSFIQTINSELAACKKLQKFCSEKWKDHVLPEEINIENLASDNYQSGNYHFSLSEDKILTLLTGDGLYNDDFIFIRELLQNAIDTSRHREFRERMTNPSFQAEPIKVSFFTDKQGYQWIRIDDSGMGMNEEIITNHLLKKGESYYNSDKFKLEKISINKATHKDFVPISRFGIGLLSCFMAGDKIEISTKYYSEQSASFRLGIEGRNSSYVFQSSIKRHVPEPMPAEFTENEGFRSAVGTSIAVRITTNKEFVGFDLKKNLERFVLCSPVPIIYDGDNIGGEVNDLIHKPWAKTEVLVVDQDFVEKVEKRFEIKFKAGININIEHIDITKQSFSQNLMGQLLFIAVDADYEGYTDQHRNPGFALSQEPDKLILKVSTIQITDGKQTVTEELTDVSYILDKIDIPDKLSIDPYNGRKDRHFRGIALSHNGIVIHDTEGLFRLEDDLINKKHMYTGHNNWSFIYSGIFYFQDELLPDLTVSRNGIKGLSFDLLANLSFALEALNKYIKYENHKFSFFKRKNARHDYTSYDVVKSSFYSKNKKDLDDYIKLGTVDGFLSIHTLREKITQKTEYGHVGYNSYFYETLVNFVVEENFLVSMLFDNLIANGKYFIDRKTSEFPRELQRFEPVLFLKFDNNAEKLNIAKKINIEHPYIQWYIKVADFLDAEYFYYSKQLIYEAAGGSTEKNLKKINQILTRLESVLPEELKPFQTVNITKNDFAENFEY